MLPFFPQVRDKKVFVTVTEVLASNLMCCKEKSSLRFSAKQKIKNNDLPSPQGIKLRLREPTIAENIFITCFLAQEAVILCAEKGGFIGKKRRYLSQETTVLENDSCFCRYQKHLLFWLSASCMQCQKYAFFVTKRQRVGKYRLYACLEQPFCWFYSHLS